MKTKHAIIGFSASLALATSASAVVSLVGVDSTAGANWRTAANLEADNEYGTAGYAVFGLNAADGVYQVPYDIGSTNPDNAYSLPAGVSVSTIDTAIGMWPGNAINNFGTIENPTAGNAIVSAPVLANSTGTRRFIISRSISAAHRITLLTASGDGQGTEFTLTVNDASGAMMSNYDHSANGLAYHVFDISAGTSDIVIDIASTLENRSISGIGFDAIPEPSSALLIGIGMLGVAMRRRR